MSQIFLDARSGGVGLLLAKPARALPNLGEGQNLFKNQSSASGNTKLRMQVSGSNIEIKA